MKLISCVDNRLGVLFNHRRVSQDITIIEDLQDLIQQQPLYVDDYSAPLFQNKGFNLHIDAHLPQSDLKGYQFIEQQPLPTSFKLDDQLIVYYFNRNYPSDKKLFDPNRSPHWEIQSVSPFVGQAHDKITRVIYAYQP